MRYGNGVSPQRLYGYMIATRDEEESHMFIHSHFLNISIYPPISPSPVSHAGGKLKIRFPLLQLSQC